MNSNNAGSWFPHLEREAGCIRSSKHGETGESSEMVVVTDIFGDGENELVIDA
jgi:hypothetical protein